MAATRGSDNWDKHWRGQGNISTRIKTPSALYYTDPNLSRSSGNLSKNTQVTYIDNLTTSHTKAAIQVGVSTQIYYTNIDNLVKPSSLSLINLKPQAFGLGGTQYTLQNYITALKSSIISRQDIRGDLQDYLLDLVNYVAGNSAGFTGYDFSTLPIADIKKDFGECLGPIYCIKNGFSGKNLGVTNSSSIQIVSSTVEPLLDYYIITPSRRIKVSAKAVGNSNTLKPYTLVPPIRNNPTLLVKYQNKIEYKILELLHDNSIISGPIKACALLNIISQAAANSVANEPRQIPNRELFINLLQTNVEFRNKQTITIGEISYLCERELVEYSRLNSQKFATLINDVLFDEIFFVKLSINNGIPSFTVEETTNRVSSNNGYFRSKHGYGAKSDKLGFKV